MPKSDFTVFSVIKNGIVNGYPFVEAYASWLDFADEIFILDGQSTDGTDLVLHHLAKMSPKFRIESAPWPKVSTAGSSIAQFTNECLSRVKHRASRLLYIQADEILERATRAKLSQWHNGAVQLTRYVLFWNSFYKILRFEKDGGAGRSTAWQAIRLFPPEADPVSTGDGLSFAINPSFPLTSWDDEVLHYGWNFPVNILQKHTSHSNLYSDQLRYCKRALVAEKMLREGRYDLELLDAMDPEYIDQCYPFSGSHPDCMQHLLSAQFYDPYVGLTMLGNGARW